MGHRGQPPGPGRAPGLRGTVGVRYALPAMAALDIDEVRAVARLARLRLDEGAMEALRHDLERILDDFSALAGVDVTGVEPTAHVMDLTGGGRPDRPASCLEREKAMDSAPDAADGYFRVPRVIG